MVNVPHFDFPFSYDGNAKPRVVEQNSTDDISHCVTVVCMVERGKRLYSPNFGISDPTFETLPFARFDIQAEIMQSEPRASLQLVEQIIDQVTAQITVGIRNVN